MNDIERANSFKEFNIEQPELASFFKIHVTNSECDEIKPLIYFLNLVIRRCYRNYGINLSVIDMGNILDTSVKFSDKFQLFEKQDRTFNPENSGINKLFNQDNLMKYINKKIYGERNCPNVYSDSDSYIDIYFIVLCFILIFNNEMKKHFDDLVN
jgi:hypothetical protein